jgi:eukaryotic-like serine/threonine-protein kinase
MTQCPPREVLDHLLAGNLTDAELEAVEGHLEACRLCQERMDQLLGDRDPAGLRRMRQNRPPVNGTLRPPFLQRLKHTFPGSDGPERSRTKRAAAGPVVAGEVLPSVPGYEMVRLLSQGGMGVVYQARQRGLNRTVALKMLPAGGHAGPEASARLRTEAAAVARLRHPNIVQVYEIGEVGGCPYFSMEFVEGGSLASTLAGTPRPAREAAHLVETLARAVHAAHGQGVVHRDLKPANILLTADAAPKITDFGLAKLLDSDPGNTRSGAIVGTPSYMAPEQARGGEAVGPAADVYALGAILYELLTGRPPFKGETALETALQVMHEDPVPPARLQPKLPRDLETVCLACLEKQPHRRYASAEAVAEDLRRFLAGEPIQARPAGLVQRGVKWALRRRALAGLIAVCVLGPAVGVPVIVSLWLRAEARAEAEATARGRQEVQLYFNRIALAQREWQAYNVGRAESLLDECPAGLRNWEWRYLQRLCNAELVTCRGHSGPVDCVAYSPDGRWLASGAPEATRLWDTRTGRLLLNLSGQPKQGSTSLASSPDGRFLVTADPAPANPVRIWDTTTGREVLRLAHAERIYGVAFSPDGHTVAAAAGTVVQVWRADTGDPFRTLRGPAGVARSIAFRPDGRVLASAGADKRVRLWRVETGELIRTFEGHTLAVIGVAFSPDGCLVASVTTVKDVRLGREPELKIWDAETGRVIHNLAGHTDPIEKVTFSPDGRLLAAAGDRTIQAWDVATGKPVFVVRGHRGYRDLAFSPDGRQLATAGGDRTVRIWDATRSPQEPLAVRSDPPSVVNSLAFSPDGGCLAAGSMDYRVRLWDVRAGRLIQTLSGHGELVTCVAFSPDGRRVASASRDRTARVWDARTGREERTLRGHRDFVFGVAFSPDGQRVVTAGRDGTVRIWETDTGQELRVCAGHAGFVRGVAFSPDGRYVASGGHDATVRVWESRTGEETLRVVAPREITCIAYSPDGGSFASGTAGDDPTIQVWDAKTGRETAACRGHAHQVTRIAYSPDGRRLASGSDDRTVKLWETATGQEVLTLPAHPAGVEAVAFSADGRYLASADWRKDIKIWDASPLGETAVETP